MEFKEFSNPEGKDYDISSSLNGFDSINSSTNPYSEQLVELIGILEDISEETLQEQYGINMSEYLHPTEDTINKVSERLSIKSR